MAKFGTGLPLASFTVSTRFVPDPPAATVVGDAVNVLGAAPGTPGRPGRKVNCTVWPMANARILGPGVPPTRTLTVFFSATVDLMLKKYCPEPVAPAVTALMVLPEPVPPGRTVWPSTGLPCVSLSVTTTLTCAVLSAVNGDEVVPGPGAPVTVATVEFPGLTPPAITASACSMCSGTTTPGRVTSAVTT